MAVVSVSHKRFVRQCVFGIAHTMSRRHVANGRFPDLFCTKDDSGGPRRNKTAVEKFHRVYTNSQQDRSSACYGVIAEQRDYNFKKRWHKVGRLQYSFCGTLCLNKKTTPTLVIKTSMRQCYRVSLMFEQKMPKKLKLQVLSKKLSMYGPLKYLPRGYLAKICNKTSREEAEPKITKTLSNNLTLTSRKIFQMQKKLDDNSTFQSARDSNPRTFSAVGSETNEIAGDETCLREKMQSKGKELSNG
ncbi:hypothetical protein EAG_16124 [Camponotus floridanus]|uniref:Uncharacterized protein n=1 Tax=Camponotus floridanus TaxID=104421 RepID=E2AM35_CAMFO|nr:hypothetical protein EAG_16124 [Camponotus floridanus]